MYHFAMPSVVTRRTSLRTIMSWRNSISIPQLRQELQATAISLQLQLSQILFHNLLQRYDRGCHHLHQPRAKDVEAWGVREYATEGFQRVALPNDRQRGNKRQRQVATSCKDTGLVKTSGHGRLGAFAAPGHDPRQTTLAKHLTKKNNYGDGRVLNSGDQPLNLPTVKASRSPNPDDTRDMDTAVGPGSSKHRLPEEEPLDTGLSPGDPRHYLLTRLRSTSGRDVAGARRTLRRVVTDMLPLETMCREYCVHDITQVVRMTARQISVLACQLSRYDRYILDGNLAGGFANEDRPA